MRIAEIASARLDIKTLRKNKMYKITIEKIETEKITKKGEWGTIEKRPYTKKEMEGKYNIEEFNGKLKEFFGYQPEYQTIREKTTLILEQSIKELDLNTVLIAVNKIGI